MANSPGGPTHVLLTDREAEHIPGCNMAFRRRALEEIGGFDEQFRVAGDDVDICWRLQQRGWTIGFHAAAMVWHHRRNSVKAFWRQQRGYGSAEAQLEKKWPEKYNAPGHITWGGRVYSNALTQVFGRAGRIYQGVWGMAPFQRLYNGGPNGFWSVALMPEWHLIILLLTVLAGVGCLWKPLLLVLPLLGMALAVALVPAIVCGARAPLTKRGMSGLTRLGIRGLIVLLHLMQPLARLTGRLRLGLSPWRRRGNSASVFPRQRELRIWCEEWIAPDQRLLALETQLRSEHPGTLRGGDFDHWDFEVREGMLGSARMLLAAEDHAGSKQLLRVRIWPCWGHQGVLLVLLLGTLCLGAMINQAWGAAGLLGTLGFLLTGRILLECGAAVGALVNPFASNVSGGKE